MLKELYFVTDSGVLLSHYINDKDVIPKEVHLLSAFITAIQGFSAETFHSQLKGMEMENETIFVHYNQIYTIGVFTNDEPDRASFRLLRKLNDAFIKEYSEQLEMSEILSCEEVVKPVIVVNSIVKLSRRSFLTIFILTVILSALMWFIPLFDPREGNYVPYFAIWITGLFGGYLVPQRWWAVILSFLLAFFPSMITLFKHSVFFYADYLAVIYILPWLVIALFRDTQKISSVPIPKIPFLSSIL